MAKALAQHSRVLELLAEMPGKRQRIRMMASMKKILPCFVAMLIGVLALGAWDVQYSAAQEAVDQGYTGPNPCSLLTLADATAALRSPVVNAPHPGTGVCQYQSPTQAGDGVTLEVISGGRDQFDAARNNTSAAVPVAGIGDAAFVFVSVAGFAQVSVIKGLLYFTVTVMNQRDHDLKDSAIALARKIASRK
jgi:hypothetical protein